MLAEAIIENDEMRIVKFPREAFRGKRWTVNIEPIREITENVSVGLFDEFVGVLDSKFTTTDLKYQRVSR